MRITGGLSNVRNERVSSRAGLGVTARERIRRRWSTKPFGCAADAEDFFAACDAREGSGVEPDWEEHLKVINQSRSRGVPTPSKCVCARKPHAR